MTRQQIPVQEEKTNLHPRNKHRAPYDFPRLIAACPQLAPYVFLNPYHNLSIDFKNPGAIKMLNKALLNCFYRITQWDIPAGYLCPPIPGRADYIHYMADLLATANKGIIPRGNLIKALDIGVGANCIYPLLGHQEYGWSFVGSDIDAISIRAAQKNIADNGLSESIEVRKQPSKEQMFTTIIKPGEYFDVTLCNPPFHASLKEATAGTERKWKNLGVKKTGSKLLNFGGKNTELWYDGGEERFVGNLIAESAHFAKTCLWFTSLISKNETLKGCYQALENINAKQVETITMAQGQKTSRILAWTFMDKQEQEAGAARRWKAV